MLREQARARAGTRQPCSRAPRFRNGPRVRRRLRLLPVYFAFISGDLTKSTGAPRRPSTSVSCLGRAVIGVRAVCAAARVLCFAFGMIASHVFKLGLSSIISHLTSLPRCLCFCRQSSPRLRTDVGRASFQRGQRPRAPLMRTHTSLVGCAVEGGHAHATSSCCVHATEEVYCTRSALCQSQSRERVLW